MHETVIAEEIISKAREKGDVKSVSVEVGELAHLPFLELKEVLEAMTGWEIKVTETKAEVECKCSYVGAPKILKKIHGATVFVCPKCRSIPKVLSGDEIVLKEVEVKNVPCDSRENN